MATEVRSVDMQNLTARFRQFGSETLVTSEGGDFAFVENAVNYKSFIASKPVGKNIYFFLNKIDAVKMEIINSTNPRMNSILRNGLVSF